MYVQSFKQLIVWQKSIQLVTKIYQLTELFPKSEIYGLRSQMRRCAISIPSNIAEGRKRGSRKDFHRFLIIAYSSGAELETQIEIAKQIKFVTKNNEIDNLLEEIMKMLNVMLLKLKH